MKKGWLIGGGIAGILGIGLCAGLGVLFGGVDRFEQVARPPGSALRLIAHDSAAFDIRRRHSQSAGGEPRVCQRRHRQPRLAIQSWNG